MNKINCFFNIFGKITLGIFVLSAAYIEVIFGADCVLDISYVWGVVFLGFVAAIGYVPNYIEKELSKRAFILVNIIYFVCFNALTLFVGVKLHWFSFRYTPSIIGMELIFVILYVCMVVGSYRFDINQAKMMNDRLQKRNKDINDVDE